MWEKNSNSNTYLVTLKILSKRTQRSTDTPNGGITSKQMGKKNLVVNYQKMTKLPEYVNIDSIIELITTKQSKRLNSEKK